MSQFVGDDAGKSSEAAESAASDGAADQTTLDVMGRGAVWDGRFDPCLYQNLVFRVRTLPAEPDRPTPGLHEARDALDEAGACDVVPERQPPGPVPDPTELVELQRVPRDGMDQDGLEVGVSSD